MSLQVCNNNLSNIYVDCTKLDLPNPATLFNTLRPDIVIMENDCLTVIELTVPYETNNQKLCCYKKQRCKYLSDDLITPCGQLKVIFIEITCLGFRPRECKDFFSFLKASNANVERTMRKCSEVALRSTFYIYCRRNTEWTHPKLLKFF